MYILLSDVNTSYQIWYECHTCGMVFMLNIPVTHKFGSMTTSVPGTIENMPNTFEGGGVHIEET